MSYSFEIADQIGISNFTMATINQEHFPFTKHPPN